MADPALQLLLDPAPSTGNGIQIVRRIDPTTTVAEYYCVGQVTGVGKAMWVRCNTADTDAQRNTAIRTAFGVA